MGCGSSKSTKEKEAKSSAQQKENEGHIAISQLGITELFDNTHPGEKALDIVFIHGLDGDPEQTWKHKDTKFYWPLELKRYLNNSRVMVFGYNADISKGNVISFARMRSIASSLNKALVSKRRKPEQSNRPIVFVCHSLGGLVAKSATLNACESIPNPANDIHLLGPAIKGFVFFGVPHGGSNALSKNKPLLKMAGAATGRKLPKRLLSELEKDSYAVLDLANAFCKTPLYREEKFFIATYWEQLATKHLGSAVVSESETKIEYALANDPEPISADHSGMVKFKSNTDNYFNNVRDLLELWEERIPERHSNNTFQEEAPQSPRAGVASENVNPSRKFMCQEVRDEIQRVGDNVRGMTGKNRRKNKKS